MKKSNEKEIRAFQFIINNQIEQNILYGGIHELAQIARQLNDSYSTGPVIGTCNRDPAINFKGSPKYKTIFGGIISLIFDIIIAAFIFSHCAEFVLQEKVSIKQERVLWDLSENGQGSLSAIHDLNFTAGYAFEIDGQFPRELDPRLYTVTFVQKTGDGVKHEQRDLPHSVCEHKNKSNEKFHLNEDENKTPGTCFENADLNFQGDYTNKKQEELLIKVEKCNVQTVLPKGQRCFSSSQEQQYFKENGQPKLILLYTHNQIDEKNLDHLEQHVTMLIPEPIEIFNQPNEYINTRIGMELTEATTNQQFIGGFESFFPSHMPNKKTRKFISAGEKSFTMHKKSRKAKTNNIVRQFTLGLNRMGHRVTYTKYQLNHLLGDIGGIIKAIGLLVGLFMPAYYQTPLYTRDLLRSIYNVMPDQRPHSESMRKHGVNSIPMERLPSDKFREKLTKQEGPSKLTEDDVNYLTEIQLFPRKPFLISRCKAFTMENSPNFIKICFGHCKRHREGKLIMKGKQHINKSLDVSNIVKLSNKVKIMFHILFDKQQRYMIRSQYSSKVIDSQSESTDTIEQRQIYPEIETKLLEDVTIGEGNQINTKLVKGLLSRKARFDQKFIVGYGQMTEIGEPIENKVTQEKKSISGSKSKPHSISRKPSNIRVIEYDSIEQRFSSRGQRFITNLSPLKSQRSSTNKFQNKDITKLTDEELAESIEVPTLEELVKREQNKPGFKANHNSNNIAAFNKRAKRHYDKDHEVSQIALSKQKSETSTLAYGVTLKQIDRFKEV